MEGKIPVLVTTANRGVFFGYADPADVLKKEMALKNARNCLRWGTSMKGFLGLAEFGPDKDCRIGATAPTLNLQNITSVAECSEKAAAAWVSA